MSKAARRKGISFEQEIARRFQQVGYKQARRHLEVQMQESGTGIDLLGTGPFRVQCKKTKKYVSLNTIKEIVSEREFGDIPVLIAAGDHQEPLATMYLDDFFRMVSVMMKTIDARI